MAPFLTSKIFSSTLSSIYEEPAEAAKRQPQRMEGPVDEVVTLEPKFHRLIVTLNKIHNATPYHTLDLYKIG
jgi:hypothetical protein